MTKKEVFQLLVLIESVYPHCTTKDETIQYWFKICSEMDYEKVMAKLKKHIRISRFPPTISDIAVFTSEENDCPEKLQTWIKEGRERIKRERRKANLRPIPDWLREYSTRKSN
ncbi:replicative helicase loader/inhibitor [Neobacillus kokaensis]|uniref:Replicative helicase inhibitor G39P N-terminal domain-containing protein n=1 Tax=Neobacillus kokaensis TaxID=2759023 RepID=A0ABQ3N5M4_9BACI|nr:replicative helicase loader/inhibitor [Neobacillus kokaensis]GHI00221.1 hypothetical protein AM1BK_37630 [Neobacillus kokaensis]